jgi:hypothetical protein
MTRSRAVRATVSILLAASVAATAVAPPAAATPSPHKAQRASGDFVVGPDVTFGAPEDVRGNKCLLTVNGTLHFTGSLEGAATGTTKAVVFATCEEATAAPPGTSFDVFRFAGAFEGSIEGEPASGTLTYRGVTREGGHIDARIQLRGGDGWARLRTTDAVVLQGGSYRGKVKPAA